MQKTPQPLLALAMLVLGYCFQPATGIAQTAVKPIGKVEQLKGRATAFRADNTSEKLKKGVHVYAGDTLQTGRASTLGIVFKDGTVFALSESATIALNALVYDPGGRSNAMAVDLVQGSFAFLTGAIAPTGNMNVETAVAHIGIRGTQPWITVGPANTSFTIMTERDGTTGSYTLLRRGPRNVIATVNNATVGTNRKYVMSGPADTPRLVEKAPGEARLERVLKRIITRSLRSANARSTTPGTRQGNREGGGDGGGDGGGH